MDSVYDFDELYGATVEVYNGVDFSNLVATSTCDNLGIYSIPLDPGEYLLVAKLSNYLPINIHTKIIKGQISYEPQVRAVPLSYTGTGSVSGIVDDAAGEQ